MVSRNDHTELSTKRAFDDPCAIAHTQELLRERNHSFLQEGFVPSGVEMHLNVVNMGGCDKFQSIVGEIFQQEPLIITFPLVLPSYYFVIMDEVVHSLVLWKTRTFNQCSRSQRHGIGEVSWKNLALSSSPENNRHRGSTQSSAE
jgi:hypothetical protein